mgnify:CR=1
MNKKTKRLYSRMQYGIEKKQDEVNKLSEKRRKLEDTSTEVTTEVVAPKKKRSKR